MEKESGDFVGEFGYEPLYKITTPSRVNLIGEHTDWSDGFVLPMAIDNVNMVSYVSPRKDDVIRMLTNSLKDDEKPHYEISTLSERVKDQWVQYIQGAIAMFAEEYSRKALKGFDIVINSTIPIGAGLSSSSVLTMTSLAAMGIANNFADGDRDFSIDEAIKLIDGKGDSKESHHLLSKLCMMGCWAEYWYGTRGGSMDHFATTVSKKGKAILLDNRSHDYSYVPIPNELSIIICNTMVRHNQLYSGYAERKKEALSGFAKMEQQFPELGNIRDANIGQLESVKNKLKKKEYIRLKHIINENRRVGNFIEAMNAKDFEKMGEIANEAFDSLRYDYEVSCDELNIMQEAAVDSPGCFGARITGGGFGGCIVAFVDQKNKKEFMESIKKKYDSNLMIMNSGIKSEIWEAHSGDGMCIEKL